MPLTERIFHITRSYFFLHSSRLTVAVMLPFTLAILDWLPAGFHIGLGAMAVGLLDTQSILQKRLTFVAVLAVLMAGCVSLVSLLMVHPICFGIILIPLIFTVAILALGEGLGAAISVSLLLAITFVQDEIRTPLESLLVGGYYMVGVLWYGLVVILLWTINPNKQVHFLFGDLFSSFEKEIRQRFQIPLRVDVPDAKQAFEVLEHESQLSINIQELRQSILQRRSYAQRFTDIGKLYIICLQVVVDIHESIKVQRLNPVGASSQLRSQGFISQYEQLLENIFEACLVLAKRFYDGPAVVRLELPLQELRQLEETVEQSVFQSPSAFDIEEVQLFKKTLRNLQVILLKLQKCEEALCGKRKRMIHFKPSKNLSDFVDYNHFSFQKILNNIRIDAALFRYALRFTIGYVLAYWLSYFFELEQGYWIMLTVVVLVKPDYVVTMSRIFQRILGTILGGIIGFMILNFISHLYILLVITLIFAALSFYYFKKKYIIGVFFLTIYVLLIYGLLTDAGTDITLDRVVNTFIGVLIALIVNIGFFPDWQRNTISGLYLISLEKTAAYTLAFVALLETKDAAPYRLARKEMQVAMGNLVNSFKYMLQEPPAKQVAPSNVYSALVFFNQFQNTIGFLEKQHAIIKLQDFFAPFKSDYLVFAASLRQMSTGEIVVPEAPHINTAIESPAALGSSEEQQNYIRQNILQTETANLEQTFLALVKNHDRLKQKDFF